jgi:hypothetical protein
MQLEKRVKTIEAEIPKLEADTARMTAEMSRPEVASDYPRLSDLTEQVKRAEARTQELYAEWESLAGQLGDG